VDDIDAALHRFAAAEVALVAVNGGDGTVREIATRLRLSASFAREPVLAVLRGGTSNLIAGDVGVNGAPRRALARGSASWRQGDGERCLVQRPLLRVARGDDNAPFYGFFFGLGAIPRAMLFTRRHFESIGLTGAVGPGLTLAGALLRLLVGRIENDLLLRPGRVDVDWGRGAIVDGRFVFLLATTLERLFLGIRPSAAVGAQAPYVLGLAEPYRRLLGVLPALLRGRPSHAVTVDNGYLRAAPDRLTLEFAGSYAIDGELFETGAGEPLTITRAPPMRFLHLP